MSSTGCLRLFALWFWLLLSDVNCENTQRGCVLCVQSGQAPTVVHNDKKGYKWHSKPIFKILRGQSRDFHHSQEDLTTDSKTSQPPRQYINPIHSEAQNGNILKSQEMFSKSGFDSAAVTHGGKKLYQANSGETGQPIHIHHARKFSLFQRVKTPVGLKSNRKASVSSHWSTPSPKNQPIKTTLNELHHYRPNIHPQASHLTARPGVRSYQLFNVSSKSFEKLPASIMRGSNPASTWSPRMYNSDVISEAKGYTHVRRLKPASSKGHAHHGSHNSIYFEDGFGNVESSGRQPYHHNSMGSQSSSWHSSPPYKMPNPVHGKFQPFQRFPADDNLTAHTQSENETALTKVFSEETLHFSLNVTGMNSTVGPSVTVELGIMAVSPMLTDNPEDELQPETHNPESQSTGSGEGLSLDADNQFSISLPLQSDEKDDMVILV